MANTTFANLKIKCLRQAGNNYNSGDTTKLTVAGNIINDVLGAIQAEVRESPYFYDLENSVNTTANQAYVDLTDTDILEIISVYEIASSDSRLTQLSRREYNRINPDTTSVGGVPDTAYSVAQNLSAGVNTFRLYLYPTPASVQAVKYDYIKNIQLSADADYCALPTIYDDLIIAMFKPRFYEVIAPGDTQRHSIAVQAEQRAKEVYLPMLKTKVDQSMQVGSMRHQRGFTFNVGDTF